MNVIATGLQENSRLTAGLRQRGCSVFFVRVDALIKYLTLTVSRSTDVIVCDGTSDPDPDPTLEWSDAPAEAAMRVVKTIRKLPDTIAMNDGRKWKEIPFVLFLGAPVFLPSFYEDARSANVTLCESNYVATVYRVTSAAVSEYRQRLMRDYEELGFLVFEDHGRFRVGPALQPRKRTEGALYRGEADRRSHSLANYWTVDRDLYGIQRDIEEFESLISDAGVTEADLQRFFEANPHFLLTIRFEQAIAQPRFADLNGRIFVPDFVLKPIVAQKRDSGWEVLDLKKPQVQLLAEAGRTGRTRLSQEVMKAITQLRDYGDFFGNAANQERITSVLSHPLRYPKLAVLIGRMPRDTDIAALELAQAREADVRIVTYDEVLETQRQIFLAAN